MDVCYLLVDIRKIQFNPILASNQVISFLLFYGDPVYNFYQNEFLSIPDCFLHAISQPDLFTFSRRYFLLFYVGHYCRLHFTTQHCYGPLKNSLYHIYQEEI